jgi:hypothetical protein
MYFNYLTVCEKLKNLWATNLNFVNLRDIIIFYYANNHQKTIIPTLKHLILMSL